MATQKQIEAARDVLEGDGHRATDHTLALLVDTIEAARDLPGGLTVVPIVRLWPAEAGPNHGPLTPEREAFLRAKPAHYHVHELWPEVDALRGRVESAERAYRDSNNAHVMTLHKLDAAQARLTAIRGWAKRGARPDHPAEDGRTHPVHRSACQDVLAILKDTDPAPPDLAAKVAWMERALISLASLDEMNTLADVAFAVRAAMEGR